jgi:hypothetical protein
MVLPVWYNYDLIFYSQLNIYYPFVSHMSIEWVGLHMYADETAIPI